ncbi:endonuclease/exonuclease/phosphatase family protein [Archangium violaceum]|uniref:endonuclease/exonuclease/phosphatase family protein n=1 Tax=Archangium violaceum TaxID=83451 RepID=UPI001951F502|nr:endonuclease/exonuclease/phosphatase family protein [Archangium violaceum]QRN96388.1 endonuclease/exonuclease/phosphatase family protein [Archangium violaceum]
MENDVESCSTWEDCPGERTCINSSWSACVSVDETCQNWAPTEVWLKTSGIGPGREKTFIGFGNEIYVNTPDGLPDYLFTQGQTHITFTATGVDSNRGITSINLAGAMNRICMKRRSNAADPEERITQSYPITGKKVTSAGSSSLSTSVTVDYTTYANEWQCPTGYLPWRMDLDISAVTVNGEGKTVRTKRQRFVFVQSFKVATYNIYHGVDTNGVQNIDRVAKLLLDNDVDMVALQEADSADVRWLRQSIYIGDLKNHVYEMGNDLAIFSKFPVVSHMVIPYSVPVTGYEPAWQYVQLDLGGFQARLVNQHLTADSVGRNRGIDPVAYRRVQVEEMLQYIRFGLPAIIAGDMNSHVYAEGSSYTVYGYEITPLAEAWPYMHMCVATGCPTEPDIGARFDIDHIWVRHASPGFSFVDAYAPPRWQSPSDHPLKVARMNIAE